MQDFAPFIPDPGRKGRRVSSAWRMAVPSASICLLLFNFLLLLQNLLTSQLNITNYRTVYLHTDMCK